jgi:hypothetical protein
LRTLLRRIRIGVIVGFCTATALSAWVLCLALVSRSATLGGGTKPLDVRQVVAAYYAAGLACGVVGGALAPVRRWRVGAAIAGMMSAIALYGAIEVVRRWGQPWGGEDYAVLAILAVFFGIPVGLIYRDMFPTGGASRRPGRRRRPGSAPPVA